MLVRYFQLVLCKGLSAVVHFIYIFFYLTEVWNI